TVACTEIPIQPLETTPLFAFLKMELQFKDQAESISQINEAFSQIDQVTQQNTAYAEETASAAEELSSQSMELHAMLKQFRV
ncbi:MAG: hypothetical protein JXR91_07435, partial [Deltaproteobacteria bacterium]|nr:hypothetical protein [Deltaproteobacteria bacterium]